MNEATPERWLPVPGYEGFYEVSDLGRVRSLSRPRHPGRVLKGRPLPGSGYMQVILSVGGVKHLHYIHRLVAAAFIGPCPEGQEVRHLPDRDRKNNTLANLAYGTHLENMADQIEHGTRIEGSRHYIAALGDEDVATIRTAWAYGERPCDLADRYGVSRATISRIVHGQAYRDVSAIEAPSVICVYPGCGEPAAGRRKAQGVRQPVYCTDPGHNRMSAKRERLRLARLDRDEAARCVYPGCGEPTAKTVYPEKPLKYCVNPEHNYETAKGARRRIAKLV